MLLLTCCVHTHVHMQHCNRATRLELLCSFYVLYIPVISIYQAAETIPGVFMGDFFNILFLLIIWKFHIMHPYPARSVPPGVTAEGRGGEEIETSTTGRDMGGAL